MKTWIPSLVSVVALLYAVPAWSADTEKTSQEIEKLAKELVLKLGNRSFREREEASKELVKLGLGALKAIEEGRKNDNPEIVARCESLYLKIRRLDLERRIEEFAADNDGRIENTLPLGATYEKICGKDENARKFYIELCKNQLQLLDNAANDPKTTIGVFFDLSKLLEFRGRGVISLKTEVAAILLVGADEKIAPSIDESNIRYYRQLIGVLEKPQFLEVLFDANNGRYLRKLLFAWAKRITDPGTMQAFLFFIQQRNNTQETNLQSDTDTLEFLMDFVTSASSPGMAYQKGTAMEMVAEGCRVMEDQIAYFEGKLFKDEMTIHPGVNYCLIPVETRACDYALAVCVKLSGQSFKDYGFDILGSHSYMFNKWAFTGFTKDETRKAAFKKYAEWRKANPIQKDEPK